MDSGDFVNSEERKLRMNPLRVVAAGARHHNMQVAQ